MKKTKKTHASDGVVSVVNPADAHLYEQHPYCSMMKKMTKYQKVSFQVLAGLK